MTLFSIRKLVHDSGVSKICFNSKNDGIDILDLTIALKIY